MDFHQTKFVHRDVDSDLEGDSNCSGMFEIQINKQDLLLKAQYCADISAISSALVWAVLLCFERFAVIQQWKNAFQNLIEGQTCSQGIKQCSAFGGMRIT